jgi:hypothetical protein
MALAEAWGKSMVDYMCARLIEPGPKGDVLLLSQVRSRA